MLKIKNIPRSLLFNMVKMKIDRLIATQRETILLLGCLTICISFRMDYEELSTMQHNLKLVQSCLNRALEQNLWEA